MRVGNYQTQIVKGLWLRLTRPNDLNGSLWYPLDDWTSDPKEIENAIRLDDAFQVERPVDNTLRSSEHSTPAKASPKKEAL